MHFVTAVIITAVIKFATITKGILATIENRQKGNVLNAVVNYYIIVSQCLSHR